MPGKELEFANIKVGEAEIKPGTTNVELIPEKLKWGYVLCSIEQIIISR